MKVFVAILAVLSLALAEPPIGDGYAAHDDNHGHHATDHQSPSQEYGPPSDSSASRNAPNGYEYNALNTRSSLNARQNHSPPKVRVSFNQRFGSPNSRNSKGYSNMNAKSLSQEYAAPNARNGLSQEYGPPAARSLSQEYGVPSAASARALSTEYGTPNARSSPSQEYGVPEIAARSNPKPQASSFRNAQSVKPVVDEHSTAAVRSQFQSSSFSSATAQSARSNNAGQGFETPEPFAKTARPSSRSQLTSHSEPSKNAGFRSQDNQKNGRSLSQVSGLPSSRTNLITSAVPSSYASARSAPSSTYLPAARNSAPSEQYGVPEQRDGENQGYDYARARALEELQNQEPASYDFGYQIEDQESGSDFGHTETREENSAQGSYFVVLPDGNKQTVRYSADERGFQPRISVERAAGGYGEDAAGLSTSQGPY